VSLAIAHLGRYELLGELGRGGMAELYLARRLGAAGLEKLVAIKRILPHLAQDPHFVQLFQQEAKIASRLSHPNICPVDELDETDGELFLVMEYLEGLSWAELSAAVPASAGESLRLVGGVLAQACEGLHHAHTLQVIHRDVSPQNLFVTANGACKVLDFGVAKLTSDDAARSRTGVLKGKLPYMSPEQIEGASLDARSDVWAMGVVLWEALAKQPLFDRGTDFQIWTAITAGHVPALAPRGYPTSVDDVLRSALAHDRDRRFASARALGQAIRQACGALEPAQIAEVLSSHGGVRLAAKATAVTGLVERSRETASATVDLRSASRPAQRRRMPWSVIGAAAVAIVIVIAIAALSLVGRC
jgi:serine/threonine protein kinase